MRSSAASDVYKGQDYHRLACVSGGRVAREIASQRAGFHRQCDTKIEFRGFRTENDCGVHKPGRYTGDIEHHTAGSSEHAGIPRKNGGHFTPEQRVYALGCLVEQVGGDGGLSRLPDFRRAHATAVQGGAMAPAGRVFLAG